MTISKKTLFKEFIYILQIIITLNSLYIHRLYHKVLFVAVGKESSFGLEYEWRQTTVKIEEKPAVSISANNIATGNLFSVKEKRF